MKLRLIALLSVLLSLLVFAKPNHQNQTYTYQELIAAYEELANQHSQAHLYQIGKTDSGKPLHLFLLGADSSSVFQDNRVKIFINNGIHPGEPCGIDASLALLSSFISGESTIPDNVVLAVIPVYNVGGMLNRSAYSRANQQGPEEYGFRGNARNLDLNRDFIKMDSENAKAFARIFHLVDPHVLIDTHTSNGADYQYTMTLLPTAAEQLESEQQHFFREDFIPELYTRMEDAGELSSPYVYTMGKTPESGIKAYYDSPRYTAGYASLFHCIGITSEAHMLKPYKNRVEATLTLLKQVVNYSSEKADIIIDLREQARAKSLEDDHPVSLTLDTTQFKQIDFHGFEHRIIESEVTGLDRLKYAQDSPLSFKTNFYNRFHISESERVASLYIIPQAWKAVIERLRCNEVKLVPLLNDTVMKVKTYYVNRNATFESPYEGHFYHKEIELMDTVIDKQFFAGDLFVYPDEYTGKYLAHTLYPKSYDSFLRWNFFDEIFQQKEWFSSYVFEDIATDLLQEDDELRQQFEQKKANDEAFRNNSFQQLYFIYKHSPYYESTHRLYPVFRIED